MSLDDPELASTRVDVRVVDVVVLAPAPAGSADRWQVLVMRRAAGTRCTGAWEIVHGRIERGERPSQATSPSSLTPGPK